MDTIYDRFDADALTRWSLYPDTLKMLGKLRNQGFKMALVSNVGKASLRAAMEKLDKLLQLPPILAGSESA